jgi:two-component system, NtrC family, response regulator AtoC
VNDELACLARPPRQILVAAVDMSYREAAMAGPRGDDTNSMPPPQRGTRAGGWRLHVLNATRSSRVIEPGTWVIGRNPEAWLTIPDESVSREHACLRVAEVVTIEDLGSRNGTFVEGRRIPAHRAREIVGETVVRLGAVALPLTYDSLADDDEPLSTTEFERRLRQETAAAHREGEIGLVTVSYTGGVPPDPREVQRQLGALAVSAPWGPSPAAVDGTSSGAGAGELRALVAGGVEQGAPALARLQGWLEGQPIEARAHIQYVPRADAPPGQVLVNPTMVTLYQQAQRLGAGSISVLIIGETGAGKELLAEAVWRSSRRAGQRLVRLNCAALAESLLESELFGHEKGAFSGAQTAKAGLLEEASGGTLLLDEVGELSATAQAKLLRCLEEGEVTRVGGVKPRPINVRFLAATNRSLEDEVAVGRFRRDLYFRLAGAVLEIPPLRARRDEIVPLAEAFAASVAAELGTPPPVLAPTAAAALLAYSWPGNIRELRNAIGRAVLLVDRVIEAIHLPNFIRAAAAPPATAPANLGDTAATPEEIAPIALDKVTAGAEGERERLLRVLAAHGGNQSKAAQALGVSRVTLGKWLERHAIPRPRK